MTRSRACAALALALLLATAAGRARATGEDPWAELRAAYYDFEVAGYCALVDDEVGAGFRREVERITRGDPPDQDTVDRLRGEAWQAAHAEWQNRGLGGFRGWCRNEGRAAAERFRGALSERR